jgi:hypothetical protein
MVIAKSKKKYSSLAAQLRKLFVDWEALPDMSVGSQRFF